MCKENWAGKRLLTLGKERQYPVSVSVFLLELAQALSVKVSRQGPASPRAHPRCKWGHGRATGKELQARGHAGSCPVLSSPRSPGRRYRRPAETPRSWLVTIKPKSVLHHRRILPTAHGSPLPTAPQADDTCPGARRERRLSLCSHPVSCYSAEAFLGLREACSVK